MTKDFLALKEYLEGNDLPAGLKIHCEKCHIVIPSDAPRVDGGDCERIMLAKQAPFDMGEHATAAGRHVMAVAAWSLIYHRELQSGTHEEASAYLAHFRADRKGHYEKSCVRTSLQDHHIASDSIKHNGRDRWLYQ